MSKLSVDFSQQATDILAGLAARNHMTKIEVLGLAITLLDVVDRSVTHAVPEGSRHLAIVDEKGQVIQRLVVV